MIKLKVKKGDWIAYSEGYITNGEYLFHQDYLDKIYSDNSFVNMVANTNGFIYTNAMYNTNCETPKTKQLIPNEIEGYILKKTELLLDRGREGYARLFKIYGDDETELVIGIDEKYAQMFSEYKFIVNEFKDNKAIIMLHDDKIVGLVMPCVLRNHKISITLK